MCSTQKGDFHIIKSASRRIKRFLLDAWLDRVSVVRRAGCKRSERQVHIQDCAYVEPRRGYLRPLQILFARSGPKQTVEESEQVPSPYNLLLKANDQVASHSAKISLQGQQL